MMDQITKILKNILNTTNTIAFKIGMVVSLLCLCLFSILNFLVVKESKQSFLNTVESIQVIPGQNCSTNYSPSRGYTFVVPGKGAFNILKFDAEGKERPKPLDQEFIEDFQYSLIKIGIISVIFSFIVAYIASSIFTNPLDKLADGMQKLRSNDYKQELDEIGSVEFDKVIKEFNHLTKELNKVEELRKDLISDTSHELKTPITGLLVQLEGIKDGVIKPDSARISGLIDQVNRLNELVERLQEFSRLRNKNTKLTKTTFKLADIIEPIIEERKDKLEAAKIKFINKLSGNLELNADKHMLIQVFQNLIDNAIRYSKAKKITISADDNKIILSDDGVGIAQEHLPYIFERFYRVDKSRNRKTGGLGLGLAIVKEIIEVHGWKIYATSKKGLKISIVLDR